MSQAPPEKVVHRLKAAGLVPAGIPIRIVCPYRGNRMLSYKWYAEDATTGQCLKVGGTEPTKEMCRREFIIDHRADGWTIITPGDLIPRGHPGGAEPIIYGNGRRR